MGVSALRVEHFHCPAFHCAPFALPERAATDCRALARQYLRAIAEALRPCGRHAAFYLAAAVSDFFIPWRDMVRDAAAAHRPKRLH